MIKATHQLCAVGTVAFDLLGHWGSQFDMEDFEGHAEKQWMFALMAKMVVHVSINSALNLQGVPTGYSNATSTDAVATAVART